MNTPIPANPALSARHIHTLQQPPRYLGTLDSLSGD